MSMLILHNESIINPCMAIKYSKNIIMTIYFEIALPTIYLVEEYIIQNSFVNHNRMHLTDK